MGHFKSKIKGVGILDPGPIDNRSLFDQSGKVKPDLQPSDYVVLEPAIWKFLWEHYGGGPVVKRDQCDIYSSPVDVSEELREFEERIRSLKETPNK
mmetsp:Transcript_23083/g.26463  ORF Transcript_23083/g.26463 Transcript_23083/m.26463 type:complete len:96 (+) Transcript_23083:49-336(+)